MRMWWRLLGLVVLFLGTQLLISVFGTVVCSFLQIDPQGIDVLATLLLLSNLLVAVFLFGCRILPFKETFRRYSWNMKEVAFLVGLTLLAIIPVNGLTELLRLPDILQTSFAGLMANPLGVLNIVVLGPLVEELIFRKGMLDILRRGHYFPVWAIVISSVTFGVIHGNPAQIPGAFLFGLLLGWIYWRTNSIWTVWLLHALNNLIGVLTFTIWGEDQKLMDLFGPWGLGALILCSFVAFVGLALSYRKAFKSKAPVSFNEE